MEVAQQLSALDHTMVPHVVRLTIFKPMHPIIFLYVQQFLRNKKVINVATICCRFVYLKDLIALVQLRWTVQWCPKFCHSTTQLDSHQRGEAHQILRDRSSG